MTPEGYTRVYVGGLNESIKKEDLQTEFENSMNGTEIMGAKLRVEISRGRGRGGGRGGMGGFRGSRGGAARGYGSAASIAFNYRGNNMYADYGGYYAGKGGGSRSRDYYGEDYMTNRTGGYVTRDGYTQDVYNSGDPNADYYTNKGTGTSRYRSRSPAGRGSHRHLRECT
ncbi:hypothetical protein ANTQUA_LOCUS262 [Anthophora quadrimaculata]